MLESDLAMLYGVSIGAANRAVKRIDYCVYREEEFFVAQCLNVDVSSFGHAREEACAD